MKVAIHQCASLGVDMYFYFSMSTPRSRMARLYGVLIL